MQLTKNAQSRKAGCSQCKKPHLSSSGIPSWLSCQTNRRKFSAASGTSTIGNLARLAVARSNRRRNASLAASDGCVGPLAANREPGLPAGKCWLAGVGPGSWDHVTIKVARLIVQADVIVYDDLGTQELLSGALDSCELMYVGKRGGQLSIKQADINKLLVMSCKQGKRVLRLKGGCPSTFSRVSSEAAALAAAGCPFELVPGLSTATAAPVLAGLPLTDPQLSGAYAVLSAHDPDAVQWEVFKNVPTLVILMGGRALPRIVEKLRQTFYSAGTMPVALIKNAGTCQQQVWISTLDNLENDSRAAVPLSPCVIVVGKVAALSTAWRQVRGKQH